MRIHRELSTKVSGEPVFFTKDGYVDPIRKRFSHQKAFSDIRRRLRKK